jgi:hypothetical protein
MIHQPMLLLRLRFPPGAGQTLPSGSSGSETELPWISAIGLLTVKGMVESLEDPLIYSDDQLIEGLARCIQ